MPFPDTHDMTSLAPEAACIRLRPGAQHLAAHGSARRLAAGRLAESKRTQTTGASLCSWLFITSSGQAASQPSLCSQRHSRVGRPYRGEVKPKR